MASTPQPSLRISLEQWRALVAVVEAGGYAQAAATLHKSQSTLTYAVQKIEQLLKLKAFEIQGRKAVLTDKGKVLYQRGKSLLDEAAKLERAASTLAAGWEPELRIAVEILFPTWLLLQCLGRFGEEHPDTRIELHESVISGAQEALLAGEVDFAISPVVPTGFLGDALTSFRLVPAAHPEHPLHRLDRPLTLGDLKAHRNLLIRETGSQRTQAPVVAAAQRWVVSNKATSIRAATLGFGYAWYPEDTIREELAAGQLKLLPMREGADRRGTLYLIFADPDAAGPGARRLAEIIREEVKRCCP